jgi:hypothetical protein
MRKFLPLSAVVSLVVCVLPVRAEDECRALIEKAVKAHGGLEKLKKLKTAGVRSKVKGKIHQLGGIDVTMETFVQGDKLKTVIEGKVAQVPFTQTVVRNGDKVWINVNGQDIKLDEKKVLAEVKEQIYAERVAGLLFLQQKGYEMSPLGEIKVEDRPAVGVRVSSKGHRDVNLYFDKTKGLLIKIETRSLDFTSNQEATDEKILLDYKEADGYLQPTRMLMNRDGKRFMDLDIEEVKHVDKFDDDVFAKP